jgi:simple sugar transport system ATP-binding protein
MEAVPPAVELIKITKHFPGVLANAQVSVSVAQGEVHALVGENGAGKSTLMNILYGLVRPDSGQIRVRGRAVEFHSPRDAIAQGLGMVHQHFMLVPSYTVAENIVLGQEPQRYGLFDRRAAERNVAALSEKYHLRVDPRATIWDLPVGAQQRVEILKALYCGAETIILDEPTAVLTPQESDQLFNTIRLLIADGKTVIFITHKLYEVKAISDRVTVMRKGRVVDTMPTAEVTENDLARMMVGQEIEALTPGPPPRLGDVILRVRNLSVQNNLGLPAVQGVSFEVRAGEVVTVAGVEGNGQTELIEAIAGMRKIGTGVIILNGANVAGQSPDAVRSRGLAHVPEDRILTGLNLKGSVAENLIARRHHRPPLAVKGWLRPGAIRTFAQELVARYNIKTPTVEAQAKTLSGGNLQKVVVAREFQFDAPLLILAQPTRGVDIGSAHFIRNAFLEKRNQGRAVLLVSTDLDEVFSVSDRILVLYHGRITGEFKPGATTREELGLYMIGARSQEQAELVEQP